MTQKEKQLLLITLCGMLPYGVIASVRGSDEEFQHFRILGVKDGKVWVENDILGVDDFDDVEVVKPYLRPMSSMTEEEEQYVLNTWSEDDLNNGIDLMYDNYMMLGYASDFIDWLNEHHFDYRELIEKSLAIVAPEDMYKTK